MGSIRLGDQDDQRAGRDAVGLEHGDNRAFVEPRASSGEGRAVSTARRQRRPEGDAGIRKQRLPPGVHRDVKSRSTVPGGQLRPSSAKASEWLRARSRAGKARRRARRCRAAGDLPARKNVRRRRAGCRFRRAINCRTNRRKSACLSASVQSTQLISLSWHQALLLPCWVRRNSSPPRSIGTPCESSSVAIRLRAWRLRSARTAGSSVGPSTPQFQLKLASEPSRLPSPLASLCFCCRRRGRPA